MEPALPHNSLVDRHQGAADTLQGPAVVGTVEQKLAGINLGRVEGAERMYERCVEGVWKVRGRCVEGV